MKFEDISRGLGLASPLPLRAKAGQAVVALETEKAEDERQRALKEGETVHGKLAQDTSNREKIDSPTNEVY